MLGQHVYVEADYGQSEEKAGIWLDESFICDADTDSHMFGLTMEKENWRSVL